MITIIEKLRNLIGDNLITTGRDVFEFSSIVSSKIFTLTESNIDASTILVYKNGVLWAGTNYSYSATTGKITVTGTLTAGDSLEVNYSFYQKYSDNELIGHIKSAIYYLATEKFGTYAIKSDNIIYPTPTESEEDLIAIIASILINGNIRSYRTPEITITFNENESVSKRIKKIVRMFKKTYGVLTYIKMDETIVLDED